MRLGEVLSLIEGSMLIISQLDRIKRLAHEIIPLLPAESDVIRIIGVIGIII